MHIRSLILALIFLQTHFFLMGCPAIETGDSTPTPSTPPSETVVPSVPQAFGGTLWANPDLYPVIPLQILATPNSTVEVQIDDQEIIAQETTDGLFIASLPIGETGAGVYPLTITVGQKEMENPPTLHVGIEGIQITNWDETGAAHTPRLHQDDGHLYLTWADSRHEFRRVLLQEIDGAGQILGEPVSLTPEDKDVLYGRAAIGDGFVGILYQEVASPLVNWFRVTDMQGQEVVAPILLDEDSGASAWGGDLSFSEGAFVAVWRNSTGGNEAFSEIRWLKVNPSQQEVTGPKVITTSGDENPIGGFLPYTFIHAETIADVTMVTFSRDLYDTLLEMTIVRNYATMVDGEGEVIAEGVLPNAYALSFGFETKVHAIGSKFIPLWTATDLGSTADNPPHQIYGAIIDPQSTENPKDYIYAPVTVAAEARSQMTLVAHPNHFAIMAWIDERSRSESITEGRYELYFTALDESLSPGEERKIAHGRFIVDASQINGTALGSNVLLVWLDERKGGGSVLNSKPEIYMETLWY